MAALKRNHAESLSQNIPYPFDENSVKRVRGGSISSLGGSPPSETMKMYLSVLHEIEDEIIFAMKSIERSAGEETRLSHFRERADCSQINLG